MNHFPTLFSCHLVFPPDRTGKTDTRQFPAKTFLKGMLDLDVKKCCWKTRLQLSLSLDPGRTKSTK